MGKQNYLRVAPSLRPKPPGQVRTPSRLLKEGPLAFPITSQQGDTVVELAAKRPRFRRGRGWVLLLARPKASPVTAAGPRTANGELAARPPEVGYSMLMIWLSIAHANAKVASSNLPCACRLAPRARQSNDFG